jgi:hypothetical protein
MKNGCFLGYFDRFFDIFIFSSLGILLLCTFLVGQEKIPKEHRKHPV